MTETPRRVERAVRDDGAFDPTDDGRFELTTTVFEAVMTATETDGRIDFEVRMRAPSLSAAVDGDVADVIEEGWLETFERRIEDVGGAMRGDDAPEPTVRATTDEIVVEAAFTDINERRGVGDAAAIVNYAEGTYVQGLIPGYDYVDPVAGLVDRARRTGER
ncbi:DUF5813 family protein [Haloplanus salilacus]|uniref:DUF5813 family protein n=1 Tax=Haloplanus salilacus TaxID=2949994 RepID=UPI0030D5734B